MTTRKTALDRGRAAAALLAAAACVLGGAGCSTPGPLHLYSLTREGERSIADTGDQQVTSGPSFLEKGDDVLGFAYDPFTDHFFLLLAPGERIRVVDRPARAIKREFALEGRPRVRGELAVRPRDGHLFLLGASPGRIVEITRLGKAVGEFTLTGDVGSPVGLALDSSQDHLLALAADGQRVTVHDLRGRWLRELRLERPVGSSLAFSADRREFFAPLRDRPHEIGVFAADGRYLRTIVVPQGAGLIDVGPRSFVRVF